MTNQPAVAYFADYERNQTMKTNGRTGSTIDLIVARRLKKVRLENGLTQTDLANKLGVTFQQVQKYENGKNRISAGKLFIAAHILGCGLGDLYYGAAAAARREGLI